MATVKCPENVEPEDNHFKTGGHQIQRDSTLTAHLLGHVIHKMRDLGMKIQDCPSQKSLET